MKQIYKYLLAVCATLAVAATSQAQTAITPSGVMISNVVMEQSGSRLQVAMTMDISDVHVRSNRSLRITPIVTNGSEMIQLPAVVIDGRRRHIVHERNESELYESVDTYIRRYNRKQQVENYGADLPYERWMGNSELVLREEWTSCHDATLSEDMVAVAQLTPPRQPVAATPAQPSSKPKTAYIMPSPSELTQSSQNSIDVYFPVNKSNISNTFMDNSQEMSDLKDALAQAGVKSIHLMGYASPEGPIDFNRSLAARRAEAVKSYLTTNYPDTKVAITTDSSPANWDAVKKLLSESAIENWRDIVGIIDNNSIAAADKNNTIRERYPEDYNFMLTTWYPKLRLTNITIEHDKRNLTVDEAKRVMRNTPQQLTLDDLYLIALSYDKGSKEWDEVILLAVEGYPQSNEARINAANVAMANGNYTKAAEYLQGVPDSIPAAANARGILAMSQGRYEQAMTLFQQALRGGVSEASYNITLLQELMNAAQ